MTAPAWLLASFPKALADEVESIARLLPQVTHEPKDPFEVLIRGERLQIPGRIYHAEVAQPTTTPAAAILGCLYTRRHDGFVRQKSLACVLPVDEPWVVPFVLRLAGE